MMSESLGFAITARSRGTDLADQSLSAPLLCFTSCRGAHGEGPKTMPDWIRSSPAEMRTTAHHTDRSRHVITRFSACYPLLPRFSTTLLRIASPSVAGRTVTIPAPEVPVCRSMPDDVTRQSLSGPLRWSKVAAFLLGTSRITGTAPSAFKSRGRHGLITTTRKGRRREFCAMRQAWCVLPSCFHFGFQDERSAHVVRQQTVSAARWRR